MGEATGVGGDTGAAFEPSAGTSVPRREDPRFLTGRGNYVDDVRLPRTVHMTVVRSPWAHASIRSIDIAAARSAPGVVGVWTGADLTGRMGGVPCAWQVPGCDLKVPAHPALAAERVRYAGDGVAIVVAETLAAALDAAELVDVDYDPRDAVVDPELAAAPGAPQVHDDVPGNLAFTWKIRGGDPERAFADAEVRVACRIVHPRVQPTAMEPRAALAQWNAGTGQLTLWSTSQNPHIARVLCALVLGISENRVRIVSPDVGGGFGSKIPVYADELLAAFASRELGRPVRWTEDRSENFRATIHGRDHVQHVELCGTRDGQVTGLRTRVLAGLGAYASTAAPGIPTILHGLMYSGPYTIPALDGEVRGIYTTATPVDAYRGAGRPEATFLLERLMDLFAHETGLDRTEVRRRNLIPRESFPYQSVTGVTYDSGDYHKALDLCLGRIGYDAFRAEQSTAREQGRILGIGVACYTEICGLGPSKIAGAVGFGGGLYESAVVRAYPTGTVRAYIGARPHGQGEETTCAQLVADELGLRPDDVEVVAGDTESTPQGWGTYGSRTTAVSGSAVILATRRMRDKAARIAAHMLGAAESEIEWADGAFRVRGEPSRAKHFGEVAYAANTGWDLPAGVEPGLEATASFDPPDFVYPFGTHACTVEIDPATGKTTILRYVAVDDCGPRIHPQIVEGQIHGGVVQGIGEALMETAVHDGDGQLLTGSLMDYAIPRAADVPHIEVLHTETPTHINPLGRKGIGEAGTIAAVPAVVSAVLDALAPFGIRHLDKPLTAAKVWTAIEDARAREVRS